MEPECWEGGEKLTQTAATLGFLFHPASHPGSHQLLALPVCEGESLVEV